jgi:4-hydroxybutyryl-CoA synthetase (ADP-forming)
VRTVLRLKEAHVSLWVLEGVLACVALTIIVIFLGYSLGAKSTSGWAGVAMAMTGFVATVIAMCTPSATLDYNKLAEVIVSMSKKYKKTILASLMGLDEGIKNRQIMAEGDVPYYTYAEAAIHTLKAMLRFVEWIKSPEGKIVTFKVDTNKAKKIFDKVKQEKRQNLLEEEGQEILRAYGLPLPQSALAKTEQGAVKIAKKIGYPVVLKIASPQIIHKSDAGGVKVNIQNDKDVRLLPFFNFVEQINCFTF